MPRERIHWGRAVRVVASAKSYVGFTMAGVKTAPEYDSDRRLEWNEEGLRFRHRGCRSH
ncbi:MAG TPA: hypothetical protein VFO18_02195 [Methylomirabilota bacterium]|nr:hypothetical protein [Methylomirabilota bacterium]